MAFRDELRPASFRGVAFSAGGGFGRAGGRRLAVHSYPGTDEHYPEDLGRGHRRLPVTAWLLDPGAIAAAKALIEALETAGPGRLVHPVYGEITCAVESYSHAHRADDGSVISIDIAFVEAFEPKYPATAGVAAGKVKVKADALLEAASGDFLAGFPSLAEIKDFATGAIADALGPELIAGISEVAGTASAAADFARGLQSLAGEALSLVYNPAAIPGRLLGILGLGSAGFGVQGLLALASWRPDLSPFEGSSTPDRIRVKQGREAVGALVRQTAAAETARAASAATWASGRDALAARDDIAAVLDAEAETAGDPAFAALSDLRAAVYTYLTALAPSLPAVLTLSVAEPRPALSIAQDLFGDEPYAIGPGAAGIVARNRVRHPLFIAGNAVEAVRP